MDTRHMVRSKRTSRRQASQLPELVPSLEPARDRHEIRDTSAPEPTKTSDARRVEFAIEPLKEKSGVEMMTTAAEIPKKKTTTIMTSRAQTTSSVQPALQSRVREAERATVALGGEAEKDSGEDTRGRKRCAGFGHNQTAEAHSSALKPEVAEPHPRPHTRAAKAARLPTVPSSTKIHIPMQPSVQAVNPIQNEAKVATSPALLPLQKRLSATKKIALTRFPAPNKPPAGQDVIFAVNRGQAQIHEAFAKAQKQIDTLNRAQNQLDGALDSPVVPLIVQLRSSKPVSEDPDDFQGVLRSSGPFGVLSDQDCASDDAASEMMTTQCANSHQAPLRVPHITFSDAVKLAVDGIGAGTRSLPSATEKAFTPSLPNLDTTNTGSNNGAAAPQSKKPRLACLDIIGDTLRDRCIPMRAVSEESTLLQYDGGADVALAPGAFALESPIIYPDGCAQVTADRALAFAPTGPSTPFHDPSIQVSEDLEDEEVASDDDNAILEAMALGHVMSVRFAPFKLRVPDQDRARTQVIDLTNLRNDEQEDASDDKIDHIPDQNRTRAQVHDLTMFQDDEQEDSSDERNDQNAVQAQAPLQVTLARSRLPATAISFESPISFAPTVHDLQVHIPHLKDITKCASCGKEPKKYLVCARCLQTRYCGKYCQIWDWQLHGQVCVRSDNATDEEVAEFEDWVEEYWAGAMQLLSEKVVGEVEPMEVNDESDGGQNDENEEEMTDGYKAVLNTVAHEQLVDEGEPMDMDDGPAFRPQEEEQKVTDDDDYVLERVAVELGGSQNAEAALAASFVAFGCGFDVLNFEPDGSELGGEDSSEDKDDDLDQGNDESSVAEDVEDGKDDEGADDGDVSMDDEDADEGSYAEESFSDISERGKASASSQLWQQAISLHMARGGKFEPDRFRR